MASTDREPQTRPALTRELGLLDAIMIVVGSMVGSGIFIVSAESARLVGAPGWLLAVWAIAGLITVTGALCCAELAAMMPRSTSSCARPMARPRHFSSAGRCCSSFRPEPSPPWPSPSPTLRGSVWRRAAASVHPPPALMIEPAKS